MIESIRVPSFLDLPDKLLPLITELKNYRYFLLEGGRGGGKTWGVARLLAYLAHKTDLRVVCGREVQNTIDESVYTVFADLIRERNLPYEILSNEIRHRTNKSEVKFKGFREQGKAGIKGLEGCDILWIDEAQSITKPTLDIIIPTIRKEDAKVFFTMNRWKKNDPVYEQFKDREDCLHIKINYMDNPFCSKALLHEAAESKAKGEDGDYRHIWLGYPLDDIDNFLFTSKELELCQHFEFYHNEALYGFRIGAFDIARMGNDRCAFDVIEQKGPMQWEEIYTELWKKKDLAHTTGRIIDRIGKFNLDISVVDGDGMGAGVRDIANFFNNSPKNIVEWRANHASPDTVKATTGQKKASERHRDIKSWAAHLAKDMIDNEWLKINHSKTLADMETVLYDFTPGGVRFIVGKDDAKTREKMRLMGISSPDAWEALMMAVSEIRHINKVSDRKVSNLPKYADMSGDIMGQEAEGLKRLPSQCVGM